jgi:hypothetical protein
MRQQLQYYFCLLGAFLIMLPLADAQLVNYEETWQEFLKNPKTSAISKLTKPGKDQPANYVKYCLMYANSYFCADNLQSSEEMLREVAGMGPDIQARIPGFIGKYEDLKLKVAAYKACGKVWIKFLDGETIGIDVLEKEDVALANKVCEKGTLCKYFYMTSMYYYCKGSLEKSRGHFKNRVEKLVDKTSFEPKQVKGMEDRVKMMKKLWPAIDKLDIAWETLMNTDKSPGYTEDLPLIECYSIPTMKAYILRAMADICSVGDAMLKKIKALQKTNTHPIPVDVREKIEWLEKHVSTNNEGLAKLNKAWKAFVPDNKVAAIDYGYKFECDREAEIKAQLMDGFKDPCAQGKTALDNIEAIQKEHNPSLKEDTAEKLKELKSRIRKESANLAKLNETWEDFVPDDEIDGKLSITFKYCDKAAQIKAYTIDGTINFCLKGKKRISDIGKIRKIYTPDLDDEVLQKIERLNAKQAQSDQDLADLNNAWTLHLNTDKVMQWEEGFPAKDSLIRDSIRLVDFYCDKIAQTKSWIIKGHLDPCEEGEHFLNKSMELKKDAKLKYDEGLSCQVDRLKSKVYQCKYWALVLKAWQITYEECERFGPSSSAIMKADLNSDQLPCETTVEYQQLGRIGIKYTITTFLCEKINLAKMGDPEYYKKIATWVDTEVLSKYCEANMRCKEDFFIYLEGHTDGNRFGGRKYAKSLDIAEGTPFTHFIGKGGAIADTLQKTTRNITTSLKSNMELGIARAWTVKNQLDFMGVPITVGSFEHPESEKGGEFRRIEIELNITNLMLDFYEKTLKILIEESGIGNRPKLGC